MATERSHNVSHPDKLISFGYSLTMPALYVQLVWYKYVDSFGKGIDFESADVRTYDSEWPSLLRMRLKQMVLTSSSCLNVRGWPELDQGLPFLELSLTLHDS